MKLEDIKVKTDNDFIKYKWKISISLSTLKKVWKTLKTILKKR